MKPTIGRIVMFKDAEGKVMPGIITRVYTDEKNGTNEEVVNLYLFRDEPVDSPQGAQNVLMAEGPRQAQPGQWWWPERI